MSDPNLPAITLDRAQREAIRDDIRSTAGDLADLNLAFDQHNREFIIRKARQLLRLAAALDAIGWTKRDHAPDQQTIPVDADLAMWAAAAAIELEHVMPESETSDQDLDALSGTRMIADA